MGLLSPASAARSVSNLADRIDRIKHIILSASDAENIYMEKLLINNSNAGGLAKASGGCLKGKSVPVAARFGVSSKTIRDIWNRRTWPRATCHLWCLDIADSARNQYSVDRWTKVNPSLLDCDNIRIRVQLISLSRAHCQILAKPSTPGRPKGSLDSKPRKRRTITPSSMQHDCCTWPCEQPVAEQMGDAAHWRLSTDCPTVPAVMEPTRPSPPTIQEPPPSSALPFLWRVACAEAAFERDCQCGSAVIVADSGLEVRCAMADPFHGDWAHW